MNPEREKATNHRWQIQHLYFYLVSFVALILIITGSIRLAHTAAAFMIPGEKDSGGYERYPVEPWIAETPYAVATPEHLWEERFGPSLLEQERARSNAIDRENQWNSRIRELISALAYLVIALPVYLYHWRKIPLLDDLRNSGSPMAP